MRQVADLELKALRSFVAVCDAGHFAQAAASLGISPSALSRSVKTLEAWCGAALLIRTSRQVELTREGRELLPAARRVLDETEEFRTAARLAAEGRQGRLLVGYMDVAISDFLPDLVGRHRRSHADVDVDLKYGWRSQQRADLLENRLDIAFTVGALPDREMVSKKVKNYRLSLVVPAGHRLAGARNLFLAQAADELFVWGSRTQWQSLRDIVDRLFEAEGTVPRTVQEAPTRDAIFGLVASGLGVTVYPHIDGLSMRQDLAVVPLQDSGAEMSVYVSWRRNAPDIVKGFVEAIDLSAA
ncbi:MAG: hypothetical protein ABS76_06240 [Pelagibacterium sp. SCN 64-44]|nr:MAG: hypothetical protein ABS76_06240 [Pelagibacterium sp. SCN 64-44]